MAVIFYQPALTSPPHAALSVSVALFHMQTMYEDTQKFNTSV